MHTKTKVLKRESLLTNSQQESKEAYFSKMSNYSLKEEGGGTHFIAISNLY